MFIFILNNQTQIKADDYKKIWKQNIIDFSKVVFIILIKSPSAVYLQRVFFIYGYYLFVRIHLWILSVCTDTFMDIICLYGYICGYYLFVRMSEHNLLVNHKTDLHQMLTRKRGKTTEMVWFQIRS